MLPHNTPGNAISKAFGGSWNGTAEADRPRHRGGVRACLFACLFGRLGWRIDNSEEIGRAQRGALAVDRLPLLPHVDVLAHATLPGLPSVRRHSAGLLSQPRGRDHSWNRSESTKHRPELIQ